MEEEVRTSVMLCTFPRGLSPSSSPHVNGLGLCCK
ncbi:hypothetical protein SLEP1_g50709 [Rubroshorea leprosula]|uniref:Uncharacterized protein n=1 Tax=Rubroshorea leprosula TaxID=152421 RepID=A0AAV5M0X0_9ROSI|nr:hypothetical protein SLEP1_g50709 [Rubroshorea leprosula]